MFKETEVLVKINSRNVSYYKEKGYDVKIDGFTESKEILVRTQDIPKSSHVKVNVICKLCNSENSITVQKYYSNFERNNKGYYSCFDCKNIEKEKTCLVKYGKKSFSQTDKFKESESKKWKGTKKGAEKGAKTNLQKYGVESYFQTERMRVMNREWMSSEEFKKKTIETNLEKYGTDRFCKTELFKMIITKNKDKIVKKIQSVFLEKYGVNWPSKVELFVNKSLLTREKNGNIIPRSKLSDFQIYRKEVRNLTNKNKKKIFEIWDGYDYYDGEFIKGNFQFGPSHRLYPTIDHKISIMFGFMNDISVEQVSSIENLCITKRSINSYKRDMNEDGFKEILNS